MAQFGPLKKVKKTSRLPSKTKSLVNGLSVGPWDLVDLSEFWRLHARFQIVMDLWNAQNHTKELRMVWKRLYADLEFIDGSRTEPPIGKHPGKGFSHFREKRSGKWVDTVDAVWLQFDSSNLVLIEIRRRDFNPGFEAAPTHSHGQAGTTLIPSIEVKTLWAGVWMCFAQDTMRKGGAPRVCPHCEKLFYPPTSGQALLHPETSGTLLQT